MKKINRNGKKNKTNYGKSVPNANSVLKFDDLVEIDPITTNQEIAFDAWEDEYNLVLAGCAGTGKTFLGLYFALEDVLDPASPYSQVMIVRSMVPTRDMGFLPGTKEEKEEAYTKPYLQICEHLFDDKSSFTKMVSQDKIKFESTSFLRGSTWDNTIILVDEMQNLNFHELDSVITRVGENSKIIFCGDYRQSDFKFDDEKSGLHKFMAITEQLRKFKTITFGWEDIVRSDFVRDYLMTKEMLGY